MAKCREMEVNGKAERQKVAVVYYLCRNRQLEHPHFIKVELVSPDGLYLRDVLKKFDTLRGRGMAAMFSWSCKRSYKNAYFWNDLCEDDLIVPANENKYVLKGSELIGSNNSGCLAPARNIQLENSGQLTESRSSISQDDSSTLSSSSDVSPQFKTGPTKYKIYKSTLGLADASTQTEDNVKVKKRQETRTRILSIDSGTVESITNDSPPSSSGTCSSANKTDTLETLMKADGSRLIVSERLKEEVQDEEFKVPNNTRLSASNMFLQLFSCGSVPAQEEYFGRTSSCSSRSLDSRYPARLLSSSVRFGELDCLSQNRSFMSMKFEDKQYFSGSLVETKSLQEEGISSLKRSSSYSANRTHKCDSTLARTKCIPRSLKASLTKQPKSVSVRLLEAPSSRILSPCPSNNSSKRMSVACSPKKPSKRPELLTDNKENVVEESLLQELESSFTQCDSKGL